MPNPPIQLPPIQHILNIVEVRDRDQYLRNQHHSASIPFFNSTSRASAVAGLSEYTGVDPVGSVLIGTRMRSPSLPQLRPYQPALPRHHSISHPNATSFAGPKMGVTPEVGREGDGRMGWTTENVQQQHVDKMHFKIEPVKQAENEFLREETRTKVEALAGASSVQPSVSQRSSKPGEQSKKQNRRSNLPKETVDILNEWLRNHYDNPYPSPQEKKELLKQTSLNPVQLSNWFINVRRRKIFQNYYKLSKNYSGSGMSHASSELPRASTEEAGSEAELDKRLSMGTLTKRKKLIDRLEELKNLSGTNV